LKQETKGKLQTFWRHRQYLIIDEMSMLSKTFLAKLSRNIGVGKVTEDFHQFPPVAVSPSEALYFPTNPVRDGTDSQIGRAIYEEFDTVVVLKEQVRVEDGVWLDFLRHPRMGQVREQDVDLLRSLVLTNPRCNCPDFHSTPWTDVSLVTPRHGVRRVWNDFALRKHACTCDGQLVHWSAEDTIKGRSLSTAERYAVAQRMSNSGDADRRYLQQLPYDMDVFVGVKVMVTENVETDLDITNGARGTVVGIICHPDTAPTQEDTAIVSLEQLPLFILVKMDRTR
ncbi:hypothetical protein EDD15DRAFT_2109312, partial [Pisolithus albus]